MDCATANSPAARRLRGTVNSPAHPAAALPARFPLRHPARRRNLAARWGALLPLLPLLWLLGGCASNPRPCQSQHRPFVFGRDTFQYANELVWEYGWDESGRWKGRPREPAPTYAHRCFVVARSAKQFFLHARFDPGLPKADAATYRERVRAVVRASPRRESPTAEQILIPGYADLAAFSEAWAGLLQSECGGSWQSYLQRGHWRMVFPFSRGHQATTAQRLARSLARGHVAVVHLVAFPSLRINHAVLVIGASEVGAETHFAVYDPNDVSQPAMLTYHHATRTFTYPANAYYPGGALDVYEVYSSCCY